MSLEIRITGQNINNVQLIYEQHNLQTRPEAIIK